MLVSLGAGYFRKDVTPGHVQQLPEIKKLVNINRAGIRDLIEIRSIGPKTAERIIDYRYTNGPFFYIEDIQKVKGIGPKNFSRIKGWITID